LEPDEFQHFVRLPLGIRPLFAGQILKESKAHELIVEKAPFHIGGKWTELLDYNSISRLLQVFSSSPSGDNPIGQSHERSNLARLDSALSWEEKTNPNEASTAKLTKPYLGDKWTEWVMAAPTVGGQEIVVVSESFISSAGILIVGFGGLAVVLTRRFQKRLRLALLLIWICAFGIAYCWLPISLVGLARLPFLIGLIYGLCCYVVLALRRSVGFQESGARSKAIVPVTIMMLAYGLLTVSPTNALPLEGSENTVFLVPTTRDDPDRAKVLVSPELIQQLDKLASLQNVTPTGVLIVAAKYEGQLNDQGMECEAEWTLHSFQDESCLFHLSLSGVQVQEDVLLNGARTLPSVANRPQKGLAFKIEGRGKHTLRMHFRVPVLVKADRRDVEFTAPRPPQSQIRLQFPKDATYPHIATRLGIQRASSSAEGAMVEADLGMISAPIHIRWLQAEVATQSSIPQVREAYLWNLRSSTASLTGRIELNAIGGSINTFEVILPDPLEVRAVSLEANGQPGGVLAPRLKQWHVRNADGQRKLIVDFQNPILGMVYLVLELAPRSGIGPDVTLPLPSVSRYSPSLSMCAYRLENIEGHIKGLAHLTGMALSDFKENWKSLGGDDVPLPGGAYNITRSQDSKAFLHLSLQGSVPLLNVTQDVLWQVKGNRAALLAKEKIRSDGTLVLAEWHVPESVVITKVTGRHVWNWSHKGSLLQVWLEKSGSTSEVEIAGWSPLKGQDNPNGKALTLNNSPVKQSLSFDLPSISPANTHSHTASIRIAPASGYIASAAQVRNLIPIPRIGAPKPELAFLASKSDYGARIFFLLQKPHIDLTQYVFAEIHAQRLKIVHTFDLVIQSGQRSSFDLRMHDAKNVEFQFEGATLLRHHEKQVASGDRLWNVEMTPNATGTHRLVLTASLPLATIKSGVAMPRSQIGGEGKRQGWVVIAQDEIAATDSIGLVSVNNGRSQDDAWKTAWPKEYDSARQNKAVWKITKEEWSLRLAVKPKKDPSTSITVYNTEHNVRMKLPNTWLHTVTWQLYQKDSSDITIVLPAKNVVTSVLVDNKELSNHQQHANRITLTMPQREGPCDLTLNWQYEDGAEACEHPRLDLPILEGASNSPTIWTATIPPELKVVHSSVVPINHARAELLRAAAQIQLSEALAESGPIEESDRNQQIAVIQTQFYRHCRSVEEALKNESATDAAKSLLLNQLHELRDRNMNLASASAFEQTRAEAEQKVRGEVLSEIGEQSQLGDRFYPALGTLVVLAAENAMAIPELELESTHTTQLRQAWIFSGILGSGCIIIWLVSLAPRLQNIVVKLWPEQLMLLGLAGILFDSHRTLFLLVIALGILTRLYILLYSCIGWIRRRVALSTSP
jgi:hypothetical protein